MAGDKHQPDAQTKRFIDAAREIDADEDELRWDERLRKVANAKPKPEKPE